MSQDTKAPREQLEGLLTGALRIILDVRKALRAVRMRGVGGPGGWFVYVKAPGRMEIDYWDTEPFEAVDFYARSAATLVPDEDKHAAKEAIIAQAEVRASLESLDDARAAEVLREFDKLRPRVPPDLLKAVAEVCEKHPMDYGSEPLFPGVTYPDARPKSVIAKNYLDEAAHLTARALELLESPASAYCTYLVSAPGARELEVVDDTPRGAVMQYVGTTGARFADLRIRVLKVHDKGAVEG